MNKRGKGKAILGIAIVAIMLATFMVPAITAKDMTNGYLTTRNSYPVNPAFVVVELTEGDTDAIKIGQEIIFDNAKEGDIVLIEGIPDTNTDGEAFSASAFVTETVTDVAGIAGNDKTIDGIYFDTTAMGRTGTYIVSCGGIGQYLSVSRPIIPLELKLGPDVVSTITVGTKLRIDCSGATDLSPNGCVDLVIIDPRGRQIKTWTVGGKTQNFDTINVAQLVEYGSTNPAMQVDTMDWIHSSHTFSVVTKEENARGLDLSSGTKTVLLTTGSLIVEISAKSVAQEDSFTVYGTAEGCDFVDIVTIAPKGGSGSGINPASVPEVPGITHDSSAVSGRDHSYSKALYVDNGADTGRYLVIVVSPGRNGVYDGLNSPDLFGSAFEARYGPIYALGSKTQDQILAIVEDATIDAAGSDDLMWIGTILVGEIETETLTLNPIADVVVGNPLEVTGETSMKEGSII